MNSPENIKKRKIIITFLVCAVTFVILFAIVNISAFSGFFSALFSVFLPIILGAALAYLLNPILKLYEFKVLKKIKNKKALRGLSILLTYLTFILILCGFAAIIIPSLIDSISRLVRESDKHFETTAKLLNEIVVWITDNEKFSTLLTGEKLESILFSIVKGFLPSSNETVDTIIGVGVGIKNVFLAFFISIYMLISKERLVAQSRKLTAAIFGVKGRRRLYRYVRIANRTFGGYFSGMIFDALIVMAVAFVAFVCFGIPYAPLIAVIIGATNVIPIFGPFIGAIPSFIIIFISEPKKALIFVIIVLVIQQIDGNIIAPKVLGNSTGISSLGVIIAITIMGEYFGILGMVVGVPIFATAIAIGKEIIDHRLRTLELPTDTAEYYEDDSLVDPYEQHETFSQRLFKRVASIFSKIFRRNGKSNTDKGKKGKKDKE